MRQLIEASRRILLAAPDTVCLERARLATEGYRAYADEPAPLKRALTFAHILDRMTLDLESNPIMAGNTSSRPRAWMLLPEYGFQVPSQAVVEDPRLEHLLDGDAIPHDLRAFWQDRALGGAAGTGHVAVDHERVLARGLNDVIAEAEGARDGDPDADVYRRACAVACRAVVTWAARYADRAAERAAETTDPPRRAALERAAAACRRVPAEPARDLFEALQALTLVHLAIHIEGHGYSVSPGRLDRLLAPFFRDDPDAVELIAAFMLKLAANSVWGSHSKTQPITVGGRDGAGADQCNALTMKVLEACERARVPDPTVFVRWHRQLPAAIKRKAVAMLGSGLSLPLLVGDEQTIAGLTRAGIAPDDAANYCIIGCNELGVPGRLAWTAVSLPEAALLNRVLADGFSADTLDDLLDAVSAQAEAVLREQVPARLESKRREARIAPTPFTSALMDGCIARGRDLCEAAAYPHLNVRSSGFTNLVNGLAALDRVVFRGGRATLADVAAALERNFEGASDLRDRLRSAPKWGNDDERVDGIALDWCRRRDAVLRRVEATDGCPPLLMEMVTRSLHHVEGRRLGATADGRPAGEPLADGIGAQAGTAAEGPTAILNSVATLEPATCWPGGYNLNLTLPLADWADDGMRDKLVALIDAFLDGGGQELQVACLDPAVLLDARDHPERYPDLMVRIAGFNAYFVRLSTAEQDELIGRARAACGRREVAPRLGGTE